MTIDQRDTAAHSARPSGAGVFARAGVAENYRETLEPTAPVVSEMPPTLAPQLPSVTAVDEVDGPIPTEVIESDSFDDLGRVTSPAKPAVATRGLRGAAARMGIRVAPGAAERAELELAAKQVADEETVRQATWTRAASILIANPKGGVGKTPTAILLGGVLATVRGGSVCVVEVADDAGSLTFRSEGSPALGVGELVRDADSITTAGQLAGYTAPQTSYASVIGTVGRRARLDREDVVAAASVIDQFYGLRIMDSGNQPSSPAFDGAVATADALVIPLYNAGDAALEAIALLDSLRAADGRRPQLAANAVLLRLADGRPENHQVVERVNRILERSGARVFDIPYDAHIAERGELSLARLALPTRRAFTAAAAGVVRSLQITVR
jgi:cellulose biosynthesis protein BcsQ